MTHLEYQDALKLIDNLISNYSDDNAYEVALLEFLCEKVIEYEMFMITGDFSSVDPEYSAKYDQAVCGDGHDPL